MHNFTKKYRSLQNRFLLKSIFIKFYQGKDKKYTFTYMYGAYTHNIYIFQIYYFKWDSLFIFIIKN